jgi:hypothetical protein
MEDKERNQYYRAFDDTASLLGSACVAVVIVCVTLGTLTVYCLLQLAK